MLTSLKVSIVDLEKAPNYNSLPDEYTGLVFDEVLIVKKGTVSGKSTIDLIFKDESGNLFVAMTTGSLLRMIANMVDQAEHQDLGSHEKN